MPPTTDQGSFRPLTPEEIEATVAKMQAEAAHARAQADAERIKAAAEAEKNQAEARKVTAEAKLAELGLGKAQYDADKADITRLKELSADEYHHVYYFKDAVDSSSTDKCMNQLKFWDRTEEPSSIEIVFFSPGGSVMSGMALFDTIVGMRDKGWHFVTNCRGYAASMAGILLQAGDERVCGPESYILIHEISSMAIGKIGEMEDEVEFLRLVQDRVWNIFVTRSGGKVSKTKLKAMVRRKDFWIDSTRALRLGIIDSIR